MKIEIPFTQELLNESASEVSLDVALQMLLIAHGVRDDDAARVTGYVLDIINELEKINDSE